MSIKKRERKLKVVYEGKMDMELDKKIRGLMESLGWEWYGQGFNRITTERDICFKREEG